MEKEKTPVLNRYKVSFTLVSEIDNSQKLKGMIEDSLIKDVVGEFESMEGLPVDFDSID